MIKCNHLHAVVTKRAEQSPVRKQLSEHADVLFNACTEPVIGYGLVLFHTDGQRSTSWHTSSMGLLGHNNLIDFPDACRNALKEAIRDSKI